MKNFTTKNNINQNWLNLKKKECAVNSIEAENLVFNSVEFQDF